MNALREVSWSPYAVGAGIGALSWLSFATAKKPLGITAPFESTAARLGQLAPQVSGVNAYLAKNEEVPRIDWEWALAVGVLAGSALSARASNDVDVGVLSPTWTRRFGTGHATRYTAAFVGGALMMFGARMAKGCTSGHGISGTLQLAASSWLFSPLMAITAGLVARSLFGRRR
jgi:uncharacterized protein